MKQCKAWLLVEAKRSQYGAVIKGTGKRQLDSVRAVKMTASKPSAGDDQEAIEVILDFPDDYFDVAPTSVHIQVPSNKPETPPKVTTAKVRPKSPSAAAAVVQR